MIDQPGVYDIPADEYHADPVEGGSLSSSGARLLLPPSCPALFKHRRESPQPPKREYDFGHAAHKLVLGEGADIVIVRADNWRTNAAKEQRDTAYAAGKVPLLEDEYEKAVEMAAAVRTHSIANALLQRGKAEQTLVWQDPSGVWRRALVDWLPTHSGRPILVDYKTTQSADLNSIRKSVANFGYHQQAPWYLDGFTALGLGEKPAFVFIFQEKTAPYLVTVVQLDDVALQVGRALNQQAIEIYRDCTEADLWPTYTQDIELVSLPRWAQHAYLEDIAS